MDLLEIIAHVLLVEGRLRASGTIAGERPESRGIGRQDLVAEDDLAVINSKLEFDVGNDDASWKARIPRRGCKLQSSDP